jgi:hypothetical protein
MWKTTSTCGIACPPVHDKIIIEKSQVLRNIPAKDWLSCWFHILEIAMQV